MSHYDGNCTQFGTVGGRAACGFRRGTAEESAAAFGFRTEHIVYLAHFLIKLVPSGEFLAIERQEYVATANSGLFCGAALGHAVYQRGGKDFHEARLVLQHVEQVQIAGQGELHFLSLAQDYD